MRTLFVNWIRHEIGKFLFDVTLTPGGKRWCAEWYRPRRKAFLDGVYERCVKDIVVAYKDRLCRFGVEFVEWLCKKSDCRLVVHNEDSSNGESLTHELSDDLLSIVTVFVARSNGQRSALNRKRRRADHAVQSAQDTLASNARTA